MTSPSIDWKAVRTRLSDGRAELFDRFLENPTDMRLAREIRLLDDRMAECTERLERERKRRHATERPYSPVKEPRESLD